MSFLYYFFLKAYLNFTSNSNTMLRIITGLIITANLLASTASAQYEKLVEIKGRSVNIFYSSGHGKRAAAIADRVDRAMAYYRDLLGFSPAVTLLVLTGEDWPHYTDFPVFGMPHYNGDKLLVVAATDNAFWKSFIPPMDQLPPALAEQIQKVYRDENDSLSMQAFFDLLALHELGHAFHFQAGLNMQRKWMGELYVNILLHTYVAEKEPEQLPALTLFPKMVINSGTKGYLFTSLKDVHEKYDEIGQRHPKNYGWYQSRWHAAAGKIYDAAGKYVGRKLWDSLKAHPAALSDDQLPDFMQQSVHPAVADMIRNWDKETIH